MNQTRYVCLHCKKPANEAELLDSIDPEWESKEGVPFPFGVSWIVPQQAWNFALYSMHTTALTLLLYSDENFVEPIITFQFDRIRNKSGPVWHARISRSDCPAAKYYAYRATGPENGNGFNGIAFDSRKILIDPYAKSVYFPENFERSAAIHPGANDGKAPLGLLTVCQCSSPNRQVHRPRHGADLVIYELHVRGFTNRPNSEVSEERRGTFAGIIDKIPYLKQLGVTAVELMPVFQFDPGEQNYWGYMPLNFFSPHQGYATEGDACQQHANFREMVDALHAAEIEVILDVVYNHTCEGDQSGPNYCYKGIDNETYYISSGPSANDGPYANFSGTGNTLRTSHRVVQKLILDSLRYWTLEMGVDGFRFDLASIFTRNSDGSINMDDPPVFAQIAADPALSGVRLIAEPWDAGGAYQLGRAFPGVHWQQWNGRYRDTLQRFVRGDSGMIRDLMTRLYGSSDLFPDNLPHAFRPFQSINYVTSHDGFSLYDLVSYNRKRNLANGHNNTDGHDDFSWNCGAEGDDNVAENVMQLRKQQVRNFFCLLMLSNGTPMFRMGDEFLNTQHGNSNPYNQDNETSWLNWELHRKNEDVFQFVCQMIAFRKSHPTLSRSHFWREDVCWFGPRGAVDMSDASQTLAFLLLRESPEDEDFYVMINAGVEVVQFEICASHQKNWQLRLDTSNAECDDICSPSESSLLNEPCYTVQPRSVVVLTRQ